MIHSTYFSFDLIAVPAPHSLVSGTAAEVFGAGSTLHDKPRAGCSGSLYGVLQCSWHNICQKVDKTLLPSQHRGINNHQYEPDIATSSM